jgi:hypothetical protein
MSSSSSASSPLATSSTFSSNLTAAFFFAMPRFAAALGLAGALALAVLPRVSYGHNVHFGVSTHLAFFFGGSTSSPSFSSSSPSSPPISATAPFFVAVAFGRFVLDFVVAALFLPKVAPPASKRFMMSRNLLLNLKLAWYKFDSWISARHGSADKTALTRRAGATLGQTLAVRMPETVFQKGRTHEAPFLDISVA